MRVLALAAVLVHLVPAHAEQSKTPPFPRPSEPAFVVIFDLRTAEPADVTTADEGGAVMFPLATVSTVDVPCDSDLDVSGPVAVGELKGYIECALGARLFGVAQAPSVTVQQRVKAAELVARSLKDLRPEQSTRAISIRGSEVVAVGIQNATEHTITACSGTADVDTYTLISGRAPRITIKEAERKTRIETDFNVLLDLVSTIATRVATATRCADPPYKQAPPKSVMWLTATPVSLSLQRAVVTLDATLPAVAPATLARSHENADTVAAAAAVYAARVQRETAEKEDLKLREEAACPPQGDARFDPLAYPACALRDSAPQTEQVLAVEALSKMATPRRASFLRWAVENKQGQVRALALVALAQVEPPPGPAAPAKGKEVTQSASFTSGPAEHWSMSADVFTTRTTPFKKTDEGLTLDGTPPVFYISLNFLLGDLLSERRSVGENIELKWLIKGSKKPLDSIGFGVGLRGSYAKRWGLDFDLVSPFYAMTWTVPEGEDEPRRRAHRFGVSLNLNRALDWVK